MKFGWDLTGGMPVSRRYKLNESMATAGVPVVVGTAGDAGLKLCAVTSGVDFVGVTLDTGTYSSTQGDAEGRVTVIINPFAVWKIHGNSGLTTGTQLPVTTNSSAETAGTVVTITTGDAAPNSPSMDEGIAVCVSGANLSQTRKITSVAATTATVTVPFLNDIALNDQFLILPWTPVDLASNNIALTTLLNEADGTIAVGTGVAMRIVDLEVDFGSVSAARTNTHVYAILDDHIFNVTT